MAGILRLERALGTPDGVNRDFSAPVGFIPGTLKVLRNGQLLDRLSDNGWEEVDPAAGTFRLKIAPLPALRLDDSPDIIDVFFESTIFLVGGGAGGGIPVIKSATLLSPKVLASLGIAPELVASKNLSNPKPPKNIAASNLEPNISGLVSFRPKIISAKEE